MSNKEALTYTLFFIRLGSSFTRTWYWLVNVINSKAARRLKKGRTIGLEATINVIKKVLFILAGENTTGKLYKAFYKSKMIKKLKEKYPKCGRFVRTHLSWKQVDINFIRKQGTTTFSKLCRLEEDQPGYIQTKLSDYGNLTDEDLFEFIRKQPAPRVELCIDGSYMYMRRPDSIDAYQLNYNPAKCRHLGSYFNHFYRHNNDFFSKNSCLLFDKWLHLLGSWPLYFKFIFK